MADFRLPPLPHPLAALESTILNRVKEYIFVHSYVSNFNIVGANTFETKLVKTIKKQNHEVRTLHSKYKYVPFRQRA